MKNHLEDTERSPVPSGTGHSRSAEYQYLNLLQEALDHGIRKVDRGTDIVLYSLFGRQTRYDLSAGFPLLTTKKVYWKGVLH